MEMEREDGAGMKSTSPPPVLHPGEGVSPSSLTSGSGTPASGEGDEGHQLMVPGRDGDDDGGGVDVTLEPSDDEEGEGADPPSNDEDDADGWSTVSEDDPLDGQSNEDDDDDDDDMGNVESTDDDIESSSEDEDDDVDDAQMDRQDQDGPGTDINDEEGSSSGRRESPSEELFGIVTGRLHPMKNEVILKTMFDLCPLKLLKNFRLVCKQWLSLSLEAWRSSATLAFCPDDKDKIQLVVNCEHVPLKKILNYVSNHCLQKPFRRYELVEVAFPVEDSKSVRFRKLWELVKRDATFLNLFACSFPNMEMFKEIIYKDLPNLKQLELGYCPIGHLERPISVRVYPENLNLKSLSISQGVYEKGYPIPMDWLELFSHFPSLTRLTFGIDHPEQVYDEPLEISESELLRVLEAIQTVRKADPRKLPLKHFDILPYFPTSPHLKQFGQVFSLLQKLHIPLPSLKLYMASGQEENVKKLASQIERSRLRRLNCYRDGIATIKFPFKGPLDNLSKLVMEDVLWKNMEFLRLVPNLATLEITDASGHRSVSAMMLSKIGKEGLADVKLLKLKEFTWGYALTEDDLRHFGNWFPNLTYLETTLDDITFPIVCEQWCDLTSLTVEGAELSDEGVTGLRAGQIVGDLDRMELPANIRLLQYLTYFGCQESLKITDVSIFNGFLKLPQLETLLLGKGPSETAKAAVEESGKMKMYLELGSN